MAATAIATAIPATIQAINSIITTIGKIVEDHKNRKEQKAAFKLPPTIADIQENVKELKSVLEDVNISNEHLDSIQRKHGYLTRFLNKINALIVSVTSKGETVPGTNGVNDVYQALTAHNDTIKNIIRSLDVLDSSDDEVDEKTAKKVEKLAKAGYNKQLGTTSSVIDPSQFLLLLDELENQGESM